MKRIVELIEQPQEKNVLERIKNEEYYNNIYEDLIAFTGMSEEQVNDRLLRTPETHYQSEFNWHNPKCFEELSWYYRTSYGYLFSNAVHPYWKYLELIEPEDGRVLDYGGGAGNNVITLAKKGIEIDYFDINLVQESFVKFRAKRHGLNNISFISSTTKEGFDPIGCITNTYWVIILEDILEHIPDYHLTLKHLIDHLEPGGLILEKTWFDNSAGEIALHLKPAVKIEEAMVGMIKRTKHYWEKESV